MNHQERAKENSDIYTEAKKKIKIYLKPGRWFWNTTTSIESQALLQGFQILLSRASQVLDRSSGPAQRHWHSSEGWKSSSDLYLISLRFQKLGVGVTLVISSDLWTHWTTQPVIWTPITVTGVKLAFLQHDPLNVRSSFKAVNESHPAIPFPLNWL